jgi:octaprenyl-diphosphate synthase
MPILKKLRRYVVTSGGKRIRPLFLYYLGKSYRLNSEELIHLGALLEIIHAASLLHDDVVDGADERRSKPTGAKLFGNKTVILGGDHLLGAGLQDLNRLKNHDYSVVFTEAVCALSVAELLQMQQHFDLKTSVATHAAIVDGKTAVLFRAAGALVAIMRGQKDFNHSETAALGLAFGRFFQMRDDYLDYFDAIRLKKRGLQDFQNGIVTAPLHKLLSVAAKSERQRISQLWKAAASGLALPAAEILGLMEKHQIAEKCAKDLESMQQRILQGLSQLPEKEPRDRIMSEFQKILAVAAP